jgi:CheY-like chemotaxis protein
LVVLSGHPLGSRDEEGIDSEKVAAVLTKPVRLEQLAEAVNQALEKGSR